MVLWFLGRAQWQYEVDGEAFILGQRAENKDEVQRSVLSTIRFTYREGFQVYMCKDIQYDTDSGWGCIIRVGQMMMAELLKRHLKNFYNLDLFQTTGLLQEILQYFNDNDEYESTKFMPQQYKHGLSIQRIMRVAYQEWSKMPGEWYSPNQIVQAIDKILADNKIPFFYSLGFVPLYDSQIDLKAILQEMCMTDKCTCGKNLFQIKQLVEELDKMPIGNLPDVVEMMPQHNQMHQIQSPDHSGEDKQMIKEKFKKYICETCFQVKRATAACLLSRIGCDEPNPDYIAVIKQLMRKPYFAGMLGGRPREANFIVGFVDDKFVVLDPHLVQSAKMDVDEYIKSCFPAEVMYIKESDIDCSLGLVFYLQNMHDVIELIYDVLANKSTSFFSFAYQMTTTYSGIDSKKQLILIEEQRKNFNSMSKQLLEMSTFDDDHDSSFETCN